MTKKIKPMEETPNAGIDYYVVGRLVRERGDEAIWVKELTFTGDLTDYRVLERGIAFKEEKHAQRAANFIFNLMRKTEPLSGCITSKPDEGARVWVTDLLSCDHYSLICFSHSNNVHQTVFKNHMLFSSQKDARAAAKFILAALKAKVLRQNLNCLTKAPADGTCVHVVSPYSRFGCLPLRFNSKDPHHMYLLESRLLYTSEEDAVRACKHLIQQINPTMPKAVPDVPDVQPPRQLRAIMVAMSNT